LDSLGAVGAKQLLPSGLDLYPFFTALDPDARLKGSRDPLGLELLWTALGRTVVGNLTTVTRSVRQFGTLLFGFYFANKAVEAMVDGQEQFLPAFLRFEQLTAYARYGEKNARSDVRGIRAVTRNISEANGSLRLSPKADFQILSDQKTYGLYGLFRMAAYSSGLLRSRDETRLTPLAEQHVEAQLRAMGLTAGIQEDIVDHIVKDGPINLAGSPVVKALSRLLKLELGGAEISFYGPHLVRGEYLVEPLPCQGRLWEYMDSMNAPGSRFGWDQEFSMAELRACIRAAESRQDAQLSAKLSRICRAEELLGAASMLFSFLLTQDRQPLTKVSERLSTRFGTGLNWLNLTDLQAAFSASPDQLQEIGDALAGGNYATACRVLIDRNAGVMRERGGSPWIVLKEDELDVRFREDSSDLPTVQAMRHPWVHTYFLNALKRVGGAVYHHQLQGDEDGAE
jgi:hypothetical protein